MTFSIARTIIHFFIAAFLAATSYPVVAPAIGVLGYIVVIIIIDVHAYVLAAQWLNTKDRSFDHRFWSSVGLTTLSAVISIYGADLTARMFVPDDHADTYQAKIDSIKTAAQAQTLSLYAEYERREAERQERWMKANKEQQDALQRRIRSLENQAWALRQNGKDASHLTDQISALTSKSESYRPVPRPSEIRPDQEQINYLRNKMAYLENRQGKWQFTTRAVEVSLWAICIIFLFSADKDERNMIFDFLDREINLKVNQRKLVDRSKEAYAKGREDGARMARQLQAELETLKKRHRLELVDAEERGMEKEVSLKKEIADLSNKLKQAEEKYKQSIKQITDLTTSGASRQTDGQRTDRLQTISRQVPDNSRTGAGQQPDKSLKLLSIKADRLSGKTAGQPDNLSGTLISVVIDGVEYNDILSLRDAAKNWYKRQFISATDSAKELNKNKWAVAEGVLKKYYDLTFVNKKVRFSPKLKNNESD